AEYLLRNFGVDKKAIFEGHPEVELALVELYRTTADRRYLDLAGYFLNGDPRNLPNVRPADLVYLFTVEPFTERESWRATPCGPCTRFPARRTITSKPAIRNIGRH